MASTGKRKLRFARESDEAEKRARPSVRLLFSLLPPDIFSRLAEDVFVRQGANALARFLVAMDSDDVARKLASNHALKMSCALNWVKIGLDAWESARTSVRDMVIARLQGSSLFHCFLCGKFADKDVRRLQPRYLEDIDVFPDLMACAPCWVKRYGSVLRLRSREHTCLPGQAISFDRYTDPTLGRVVGSDCVACAFAYVGVVDAGFFPGYPEKDVVLVKRVLSMVREFVRPDEDDAASTMIHRIFWGLHNQRLGWWANPAKHIPRDFVRIAGEYAHSAGEKRVWNRWILRLQVLSEKERPAVDSIQHKAAC